MSERDYPPSGKAHLPQPCPNCGQRALWMSWWLQAKPIGSFSLAGAQMKFSGSEVAGVECRGCGLIVPGRITKDAVVVDGRFVTGGFEATGPPMVQTEE